MTAEERIEAEQMQKDEQLRRRDPVKYFAMIEQRRQALIHQVQQATRVPTTPGSQQASAMSNQPASSHDKVAGPDSPLQLIAVPLASHLPTKDMAPSSIAPPRGTSAETMPPPTAASDSHVTPALRVERAISTPASTLHMKSTSGTATSSDAHTRSSSASPSSWTASHPALAPECLDKQLLDRQLLVPDPSPTASGDGDAEILYALKNAVENLFRHTSASPHEPLNERGAISETIQGIAKEDFYAAMSAKGLRNPIRALADAARKLYAQELSHIIFEMSRNEAEYRQLVAGVKKLLERDEVKPKHLVKVMMEKHNPVTGSSAISSHVDDPNRTQMTKANAGKVQANGKAGDDKYGAKPVGDLLSYLAPSPSPEMSPKSSGPMATAKAAQRALDLTTSEHSQESSNHKRKANGETLEPKEGPEDFIYGQRQADGSQSKKAKSANTIGPNFKNPSGHTEQQFQDLLQKEANRSSV